MVSGYQSRIGQIHSPYPISSFPILSWRRWSLILVAICSLVSSLTNIELGRGEEEAPSGERWRMVAHLYEVTFWLALIVFILLA